MLSTDVEFKEDLAKDQEIDATGTTLLTLWLDNAAGTCLAQSVSTVSWHSYQ